MPPSSDHEGPLEGFWLPAHVRDAVLGEVEWETARIDGGSLWGGDAGGVGAGDAPGVSVTWPRLNPRAWSILLDRLQHGRALTTERLLARWERALEQTTDRLLEEAPQMLPTIAACTGYSVDMLAAALGREGLLGPAGLAPAVGFSPSWSVATGWRPMAGLAGRVRFFPRSAGGRLRARLTPGAPLSRPAPTVDLVLGYAAGNVPGTGFLITLLAGLANAAGPGAHAPAALVRNSRHEPLFTPWVLRAVEAVDPELVAGVAVLVWDYTDRELQADLMRRAGLMLAAAGDDTIAALDAVRTNAAPSLRFHRHGHKASFAVIAGDVTPEEAARAGALDSALWDQNGCLSARVHFVCGEAETYAGALTDELRTLASSLPRGGTPLRFTHRLFDTYAALEGIRPVSVLSAYDDGFAVALDRRPWTPAVLQRVVNTCQGRSVVVRPVADLLEAARMLHWIPAANLQSVSLSAERDDVEGFATIAGRAGVTGIRALGRAAFPHPAYSWDGFLPLDLGRLRPPGHFTTIETDGVTDGLDRSATTEIRA